jgi:hypothetical protein
MEQENQIYRLTFDVDLPASIGEDNALAEAESCCETFVIPTVDEVLSRFDGYSIDIEKVDLDLGTVKKDEIPSVLRGLLEDEIIKRLYQDSEAERFSIVEGGSHETRKSSEPEWISYLYTGVMPWTYEDSELDLAKQMTQEVLSHLDDKDWMASFFERLSTDDAAFYRFFNLLDDETIQMVLRAPFFVEISKVRASQAMNPQKLDDLDRHQLLALAYSWIKKKERKEERAEKNKLGNDGVAYEESVEQQIVAKTTNDAELFKDLTAAFDKAVDSMKRQMVSDDETEKQCLVDDAGLVILHPFLPALFERLGYLDEEHKFVNLALQERAVHLLRWLAGYELPHLDYQMPLEKVLCDLPMNYPIESEIELTDLEKEEGRQVLRSVCQYWKPLNGTSPEGLQRSFLQRHGSITYEDNTWIVRVEGQALDILLDDLPWEISLLLLPWREEMIMVEWQRE